MRLSGLFKRKKDSKDEFERLNDVCNAAFERAFHKCRLDFGREMVEITDLKSKLLDTVKAADITAAQELLAKKLLELIPVYFRLIETYTSAKKDNHSGNVYTQALEMDAKIKRVYSLINSLNTQFYLCADKLSGGSACDEIINEAEALRNVIDESSMK